MKKTFTECERRCEMSFAHGGKYWHAYTDGRKTGLMFTNVEDYTFAMNVVAQAANEYRELELIAFAIMGNHFHFVLSSRSEDCMSAFYSFIRKRISYSIPEIRRTGISIKSIDSLQSLRNNIVYTNRNGYVADPGYTPFSYPWGTGRYYFNEIPVFHQVSEYRTDARRAMFRGRAPQLPGDWAVTDGYVSPPSYCAIAFGMALFRDAHNYFSMVSKNVEAYSGVAVEIEDGEFLTDTELFAQVVAILKDSYGQNGVRDLTKAQKYEMARLLHYDYRSSNGQIHRVLGLSKYEVDSLFPLTAKRK